MANFRIRTRVWLHNRTYAHGQEDQLEKDGFTDEEKRRQVWKGTIEMLNGFSEPAFDATPAALHFAVDNDVDMTYVEGTGSNGRITLGDVKRAVEEDEEGDVGGG